MNPQPVRAYFMKVMCLCALFAAFLLFEACGGNKDPKACSSTKECTQKFDQTYTCKDGMCEKKKAAECATDADCINEVCDNGQCVPGNVPTDGGGTDSGGGEPGTNPDTGNNPEPSACGCPAGKHCKLDTNECVDCLEDAHCGTDPSVCKNDCTAKAKQCQQNQCVEAACECPLGQTCDTTTKKCGSQKTCPGGAQPDANGNCPDPCAGTTCGANESPDPAQNCKCVGHKGWCQACTDDSECGPKGKCVTDSQGNKFCAEDCTNTSTCSDAAKYSCLNLGTHKVCMPSSGQCPCLGVQCSGGEKCCPGTGACQQCCGKADCTGDQTCHPVTFQCVEDKCKTVSCSGGAVCNPNTGKCDCPANCPQGECCDAATATCSAAACGGNPGKCTPACTGGNKCCSLMGQYACMPQCSGAGPGTGCQSDADCTNAGEKCCDLMGMGKMCLDGTIGALFGCGGGTGACKSDADCNGQKCCPGLIPGLIPNSCKPSC